MKHKNFFVGVSVLSLIIFNLVGAASAEQTSPLTDEMEQKLSAFAVQLSTPPSIVLKATLRPPETVYGVELKDAAYEEMISFLAGQQLYTSTTYPGATEWTMDISCGTAQNYTGTGDQTIIVLGRRVWSHPDGPGGCPHEEGTSHKGTISVTGDWSMSIQKDNVDLIAATWS